MTDIAACLSQQLGPLESRIEDLNQEYAQLWKQTPLEPVSCQKLYSREEKKTVERELTQLVDRMVAEQKNWTSEPGALGKEWMERRAAELRPFFTKILRRMDLKIESVFDSSFVDSTRQFLRQAREFDPDLPLASVYQAMRNVWIMNTLQYYLKLNVEHTDAIFGYSMVYPYLDNVLDDENRTLADKLALVLKLKSWLEGNEDIPQSREGRLLLALIHKIEGQFPRKLYPGVYQSMLTIFNAQLKSLFQHRQPEKISAEDILLISVEKGGTSVLADGYLVAGELEPEQEDFCFGFGFFLQLADDLQDIDEDVRRGHQTLFSREVGTRSLDPLVYRLIRLMSAILKTKLNPHRSHELALQEMIQPNCILMYMESVGKHKAYFSRICVRQFQRGFPVRFVYLKKLRRSLEKRIVTDHKKLSDLDPVSAVFLSLSSRAFALD